LRAQVELKKKRHGFGTHASFFVGIGSATTAPINKNSSHKTSLQGYVQGMVEPYLKNGALVEAKIAVRENSGKRASRGANPGADGSSFASTRRCTASRAQSCSHGGSFNRALLAPALPLNLAFGIRLLGGVFSGHSGHGGDQRHPAMIGFNLIETEQHAGMQALFHRTHVPLDSLAARQGGAVGSDQVFGQLGFEVLALFHLSGVKPVVQAD
jgi:hypothetical protein